MISISTGFFPVLQQRIYEGKARQSDETLERLPEVVPGQKLYPGRNVPRHKIVHPGLELVHDLCVRARSLDTFPLDVERAPDKRPRKKQVP